MLVQIAERQQKTLSYREMAELNLYHLADISIDVFFLTRNLLRDKKMKNFAMEPVLQKLIPHPNGDGVWR